VRWWTWVKTGQGDRNLREVAEVVELAAMGLYRSRIPQMAASLAYRTIFAIVPTLVVVVVVLQVFTPQEKLDSLVHRVFDFLGVSRIAVEDTSLFVGPPTPVEMLPDDAVTETARIDTVIQDLMDRVSDISITAIGSVGLGLLIYSALSMLVELEQAFNEIYAAPTGRSWTRRLMQYWTTLTLGVIMLGATFLDTSGWLGGLSVAGVIGFALSVGMSTLALLFLYTTIPNTRVNIHHALAGAVVAAILWETGKWGFSKYIEYSTGYEKLYGSLALIPLFLFWIYITWLIVLFGLQVSYGLQTFKDWKKRQGRYQHQQAVIEPAAIVGVLAVVVRRFRAGRASDATDVSEQTGLPAIIAFKMLELLAGAGFVHRVATGAAVGGAKGRAAESTGEAFTLARPPEEIGVAEVLAIGQQMAPAREEGRAGEVLALLRKAQRLAAAPFTIAELAADGTRAEPVPAGIAAVAGIGPADGRAGGGPAGPSA
jgi:membrane protein